MLGMPLFLFPRQAVFSSVISFCLTLVSPLIALVDGFLYYSEKLIETVKLKREIFIYLFFKNEQRNHTGNFTLLLK